MIKLNVYILTKDVQIVYRLFLVNCYLLQPASNMGVFLLKKQMVKLTEVQKSAVEFSHGLGMTAKLSWPRLHEKFCEHRICMLRYFEKKSKSYYYVFDISTNNFANPADDKYFSFFVFSFSHIIWMQIYIWA